MSDYFVQSSPVSSFLGAYEQGQQMQHQRAIDAAQQIATQHQQEMADAQQAQQVQQQQSQAANALLGHIVTGLGQGYTGEEVTKLATPFAGAAGVTLPDLTGLQGAPAKQAALDAKQKLAEFKANIWQSIVSTKAGNADKLKALQLSLDRADTPAKAQQLYIQFLSELGQPGAVQPATPVGQQPTDPLAATAAAPPDVMLGGNTPAPGSEVNPAVISAFAGQPAPTPPPANQIEQATQIGASGQAAPPDFMNTPFGGTFGARLRHMDAEDTNAAARLKVYQDLEKTKELQYQDLQQYHQWKQAHENNITKWNEDFKTAQKKHADIISNATVAINRARLALQAQGLDDRQKTAARSVILAQQKVLTNTRGDLSKQISAMDKNIITNRDKAAAVAGVLALDPPADPGKDADPKLRMQYNQALNFYNAKVMAAKDRQPDLTDEGHYFQGRRQELQDQMDEVNKSIAPISDTQNLGKAYTPKDIPAATVDVPQALRNAGVGLPGLPGTSNAPLKSKTAGSPTVMRGGDLAGKSQAQLSQIRKDIQAGKIKFVP